MQPPPEVSVMDVSKPIFIDLETISFSKELEGFDPFLGCKIGMVVIGQQGQKTVSYCLRNNYNREACVVLEDFYAWFRPWLAKINILINQNVKFDLRFLAMEKCFISDACTIMDTIHLARLVHNDLPKYSLEYLAERFGCKSKKKSTLIKDFLQSIKSKDYGDIDPIILAEYAIADVDTTIELYSILWHKLFAGLDENTSKRILNVIATDCDFMKELLKAELLGLKIDCNYLDKRKLDNLLIQIDCLTRLKDIVGHEINPASTKHIDVFMSTQRVAAVNYTEKGAPSWGTAEIETEMQSYDKEHSVHKFSKYVIDHKEADVATNTFCDGWQRLKDSDGVIHPLYNIAGTKTGRLSSNNPNLQNPPKWIMGAIEIPDGYVGVSWDLAQIEYRIFTHYSKEPWLIEAFTKDPDTDLHQIVADKLGIPRDPVKRINFGIIYGMGQAKTNRVLAGALMEHDSPQLRQKLSQFVDPFEHVVPMEGSIPSHTMEAIAKGVLQDYHKTVPSIKTLQNDLRTAIYRNGIIRNFFGRTYQLSMDKSYIALNYLCQGTAADLFKLLANKVLKANPAAKMVMNIHDSLKCIVPKDRVEEYVDSLWPIITDSPFRVPVRYDVELAHKNWGNLCKLKDKARAKKGGPLLITANEALKELSV